MKLRVSLFLLHVWFTRPHRRGQIERLACRLYREQCRDQCRRRWRVEDTQPAVILGGA